MRIPFFPLKSVFFPGEKVPLHIFEERYKQLINDCRSEAVTFGIPVYINDTITFGTEVQLVEVVNTYENGSMDVLCVARQIFKVITFDNSLDGKLYAGGNVQYLENVKDGNLADKEKVLEKLETLYSMMEVSFVPIDPNKFEIYHLVHKMGLSIEQEYQLLQLSHENDRLQFILKHLTTTIQVLSEINRTKMLIELNGHFKNFDPLEFKDFKI